MPPVVAHHTAGSSYHRTTKENDVKLMHQSLCNPPILSLIHAIKQDFLQGAPHLTLKTIRNISCQAPPHIKATQSAHGRACKAQLFGKNQLHTYPHRQAHPYPLATRPCQASSLTRTTTVLPAATVLPSSRMWAMNQQPIFFCFGAFTDKHMGIVYNDCMGEILFMSLDGNVCF
jgi:hypothetical protein